MKSLDCNQTNLDIVAKTQKSIRVHLKIISYQNLVQCHSALSIFRFLCAIRKKLNIKYHKITHKPPFFLGGGVLFKRNRDRFYIGKDQYKTYKESSKSRALQESRGHILINSYKRVRFLNRNGCGKIGRI